MLISQNTISDKIDSENELKGIVPLQFVTSVHIPLDSIGVIVQNHDIVSIIGSGENQLNYKKNKDNHLYIFSKREQYHELSLPNLRNNQKSMNFKLNFVYKINPKAQAFHLPSNQSDSFANILTVQIINVFVKLINIHSYDLENEMLMDKLRLKIQTFCKSKGYVLGQLICNIY